MTHIIRTIKTASPACYKGILFLIGMLPICLVGLLVDDRVLMGVNVWIKPLKFIISTSIYVATVGFLLSIYPYSDRKKKIIDWTIGFTLVVEILIIVIQAGRGVQSHYNVSSIIDGILFGTMGLFIAINVLLMALFLFDALRLKMRVERPMQIAISLGWVIVLVGSAVGGQMIGQMAHNIGVVDGGQGLPGLNWSTIAGDLRVAHFFGLHGIQILPLVAFGLSKLTSWAPKSRSITIIFFGLMYLLWVGFTFYQAKQGIPLIRM